MKRVLPPDFLKDLSCGLPNSLIDTSPEKLESHGRDWTRFHKPSPCGVAFPKTTKDVLKIVQLCSKHQIPIVPSGGRTGLAGGAVASKGELIISFDRMNRMDPVDALSRTLRVQAGSVTEAVHEHCAPHGLIWPVDFASKGSSQIGGNISTNAGGLKVIHDGLTRNWVLGLQVVTMKGEILELNGALEKNNTGLDLKQLFIGTEGTLGLITEATLKLAKMPGEMNVLFFALPHFRAVLDLFLEVRKSPFTLHAFETFSDKCLNLVCAEHHFKPPFSEKAGAYALMEIEHPLSTEAQDQLDHWISALFSSGLVINGTLAQSPAEAKALWAYRERISESLSQKGLPHKNDVSLPIANLVAFVDELEVHFPQKHPDLEIFLFGHIGDGNLHINTLRPSSMSVEEFLKLCHQADEDLFKLVQKYKGSISAEHGIGLLKKEALHYTRSPEEIAYLRAIKSVFDPQGLLNPGKIID